MEKEPKVIDVETCEHKETETIPISGTLEAITICHDCGCEV